jgi:type I restriction enzyme S subunit
LVKCLDGQRVPLNRGERAEVQGSIPYWGANGIVDHVAQHLFDEELVLLGEDGAPFGDATKDVAFHVSGPVWVNNHIHVLRPTAVHGRYLSYALNAVDWMPHITGSTRDKLTQDDMLGALVPIFEIEMQRRIAGVLDEETARIDALITAKWSIITRLEERAEALIGSIISASELVNSAGTPCEPIKRQLRKMTRPSVSGAATITAFRDGQVTARHLRRADGYTDSWTDGSLQQGVLAGDVVIHGLDGFSGAIGVAEVDGTCSPVNHVCQPITGDPDFLGRLLRILATTGYLQLFATSTRERAVDFRNWQRFGEIQIPTAGPAEQARVGQLVRSTRPLRAATEQQIVLLRERRKALITAAVTGELVV